MAYSIVSGQPAIEETMTQLLLRTRKSLPAVYTIPNISCDYRTLALI